MNHIQPTDAERLAQQAISERDSTEPLTALAVATPIDNVGEVEIPDSAIVAGDDADLEEEYAPRPLSNLLVEVAGELGMVRLAIRPELNFVVNIFQDEVQQELIALTNFENGDEGFNLIQPLSKRNDKTGRIGVLREPLRAFVDAAKAIVDVTETIVINPDSGVRIVDSLVGEFVTLAENTLYASFPIIDGQRALFVPAKEEDELDYILPASEYVRIRPLIEATQGETSSGVTDITVTVKFVIHMRIPLLLKENSDKFEKTLKTHFKFLAQSGIKANLPTAIYAGFASQDLADPAIAAALDWIRETDSSLEILSYRNASEGGEFFGVPGFSTADYADSLFNGGDFIVAFNLENESE